MTNITFTAEEIAAKYNLSVSTLKRNFLRTKETLYSRYGIKLEKSGRGDQTIYFIEDFNHSDPSRAITLYQSLEKNLVPAPVAAGLLDINFLVFIGIISSPQRAFRGSYLDLLKYLDIQATVENTQLVRKALQYLSNKDYIMYMEDRTDAMYFMASILKKTENDMELEIQAILTFKSLVKDTRKSWIPLMKVYLALHFLEQPCTIKELVEITELSEYKVRDTLTILASNNIIIKEKQVKQDPLSKEFYCLGTQIDINAFGLEAAAVEK